MMNRLLPKSSFIRDVSVLAGGTAGAQLILILTAPLLTRLYSPEDFGLLAVYTGILSLFTVVSSLRYELAIPLPERDEDAANVLALCLVIVLIMTGLSTMFIFIVGDLIAHVLDVPKLASYFWILPVGVFFVGIYQVFNYWAIRIKEFPLLAKTNLRQALVTAGLQIVGFKLGGVGLLLGQVSGQGVGSIRLAKLVRRSIKLKNIKASNLRDSALRYKDFPVYSTWAGFFNSAGTQIPPLMFAALFGSGVAGLYALAHRVLAIPISVVGQAVGNVFFSGAAKAHREGVLGELVQEVHKKLVCIIMPPTVILIVTAPDLFSWVFGSQWREAGIIASWLSLWLFVSFSASPLSSIFSIVERQSIGLHMQAMMLSFRIVGILIGVSFGGMLSTIIAFSISNVLAYFIYLVVSFSVSGASVRRMFKNYLYPTLIGVAAISVFVILVEEDIFSTLIMIPTLFVMAGIFYFYCFKKSY
tara:strand:- start:14396 stop:15811 length:1416 start_codon:yes stop_codon:yes gene_type:complete